jgi:DNA-binding transcriptional LysR family regulator
MVGLEVEANQSETLQKRSERGDFDLAFFKQEAGAKLGTVAQREQLVWVSGPNYVADDLQSIPLVLFPEGCTLPPDAIASLRDCQRSWHLSFVSPSFECLKAAAIERMGITVVARALVAPPLRIDRHGSRLPQLPAIELAYSHGRRSNSSAVSELANDLANSLAAAGSSLRRWSRSEV